MAKSSQNICVKYAHNDEHSSNNPSNSMRANFNRRVHDGDEAATSQCHHLEERKKF